MKTQVELLAERLYGPNGLGVTNFKFTPGDKPGLTAEDYATAINQSLDSIAAGDYEVVDTAALDAMDDLDAPSA